MKISDFIFQYTPANMMRTDSLCRVRLFVNAEKLSAVNTAPQVSLTLSRILKNSLLKEDTYPKTRYSLHMMRTRYRDMDRLIS